MPFNKRSSYTTIDNLSPSSPLAINRRYSSIPSSNYLTASSSYFTDTSHSRNPYKNNSIDTNSSNNGNNHDHFFSFNEPPPSFNWKRRSSILQAETLKNSFNELDDHHHHHNQSSLTPLSSSSSSSSAVVALPPASLSPSKNPFLTDIEVGVHPLASSDIKDNNFLSPPPMNTIQRNNNQQSFYFRRPSIYEKNENNKMKRDNEQQQQQKEEENKKDGIDNSVYSTTPFVERPIMTKDLHIVLPDVKRDYFDISTKVKEEEETLRFPYPFREKEPNNQRLERINKSSDKNRQKQQKQFYLRHSVDNSEIDRLSTIDINATDQDKMIDSNSLITSWLDTSVNI
ncbi:unnamed protein product [Cunninghamella blakesleeana]